ncbi:hypothetical protein KPL37_17845 [Clostridium frigoris]|uniref:Spo0E like sporulation regulatory protein n=1 Tax=Clostridium frigoris TaxID=205327 RepID=A0ABS6BY87_9CLOT|nr:hypothetical protein [Clostridium frigoris]MBU3161573.1 hypothetical protein [Clostridium frigoris]
MKLNGDDYKQSIKMLTCLVEDTEFTIEDINDLTEDILELILILHGIRKNLKKQK